jgi:hypothetical protein
MVALSWQKLQVQGRCDLETTPRKERWMWAWLLLPSDCPGVVSWLFGLSPIDRIRKANHPDILIIDYRFPGSHRYDGIKAISSLGDLKQRIPYSYSKSG